MRALCTAHLKVAINPTHQATGSSQGGAQVATSGSLKAAGLTLSLPVPVWAGSLQEVCRITGPTISNHRRFCVIYTYIPDHQDNLVPTFWSSPVIPSFPAHHIMSAHHTILGYSYVVEGWPAAIE